MASDIWLRTILIVRKETRCRHICYSYRLTASVLLYAPSHRQDNTYHGLCYTSCGALAGTRSKKNKKKKKKKNNNNNQKQPKTTTIIISLHLEGNIDSLVLKKLLYYGMYHVRCYIICWYMLCFVGLPPISHTPISHNCQ